MLREFLALQDQIRHRAAVVGRALQAAHHCGCMQTPFPAAVTYIGSICETAVDIVVGCTDALTVVTVRVPAQLFESGTVVSIKVWVDQQNAAHNAAVLRVETEQDTPERADDLRLLQELRAKYPTA